MSTLPPKGRGMPSDERMGSGVGRRTSATAMTAAMTPVTARASFIAGFFETTEGEEDDFITEREDEGSGKTI
jgi:hypothetical protein